MRAMSPHRPVAAPQKGREPSLQGRTTANGTTYTPYKTPPHSGPPRNACGQVINSTCGNATRWR